MHIGTKTVYLLPIMQMVEQEQRNKLPILMETIATKHLPKMDSQKQDITSEHGAYKELTECGMVVLALTLLVLVLQEILL